MYVGYVLVVMVDGVGKWCGVDYVVCYVYGGCVEVGW